MAGQLFIDDIDSAKWDSSVDLVIVGFGAAGVAAALHARADGLSVIAIDRFEGGGATAAGGGAIFAGASSVMKEAGYEDTIADTVAYLSAEGVPVKPETLDRFCREAAESIDWLKGYGVNFVPRVYEPKTISPPPGYGLYYSGNERHPDFARVSTPAPRGHMVDAIGFGGIVLYEKLRDAALADGVTLWIHARVEQLVLDKAGTVVGVEVNALPADKHAEHQRLFHEVIPIKRGGGKHADHAMKAARELEEANDQRRYVRARFGVLIASGGFILNEALLSSVRPDIGKHFKNLMPSGTMSCDGSSIALGRSAGGTTKFLDKLCIGATISPPVDALRGILVNQGGRRFINEDAYSGHLGNAIVDQVDGKAWLILNSRDFWKCFRWAAFPGQSMFLTWGLPTLMNIVFGRARRGGNIRALAKKCGIDTAGLEETVAQYDLAARQGLPDAFGKYPANVSAIGAKAVYALNVGLSNPYSLKMVLPLSGLDVDEESGAVLREDGTAIRGLYAAGRAAVGICSLVYVGGLSISDALFSARRAVNAISRVAARSRG